MARLMNYYIVSNKTDRILDVLFCPGREATPKELEAAARPLANEARCPVRVLVGKWTGLTFAPSLGHDESGEPT